VEFKNKARRVQELGQMRMCDASREEHEEYWRLLEEIVSEALVKIKEKEDENSY
jgi:hypothetical protein